MMIRSFSHSTEREKIVRKNLENDMLPCKIILKSLFVDPFQRKKFSYPPGGPFPVVEREIQIGYLR